MNTDVIIVGAGPTGLMLAAELRLGGARVVVVERLAEPTGQSRGLGFTARAMEVLDQRGLLPRFGPVETSPLGHFGGVRFDYTVLPGAHFGARGIPQSQTEDVLERRAAELGADIRRGWEFRELLAGEDAVEVTVAAPDGEHRLRAAYLVGCDGGHSAVRGAAGFDFPGTPATRRMYLADVVGAGLRPRMLGERLPGGMVMAAPLRPGVDRIIVCEHGAEPVEQDGEPDFAEVADAWQRITGEDIHGADTEWVSSFTDATRQVTEYRRGRVLLAGDAAHIHLPAGGQGMSTGLLDAVNLGWKLAATVAGWAPDGLLDSYHAERHPAGARLLMNTRAQGMIFLGGADAQPLRELLGELIEHDAVKRHLAGIVSGLDLRYEVGGGDHPLLGRRVPPVAVHGTAGQTSTTALLHPAQGVLLDIADDAAIRDAAAGWKDRVLTATAAPAGAGQPLPEHDAVLVRPDGYIAWIGSDPAELTIALHRWFGDPAG
ncbi:MAG TPA: FAD-dependent monooxygenase [Actinophytocola sp.]|uniref:FAD-dependent monooxygenase n=1 Tax=Actinophytocola sp. TaxID=1872138 RepID=UPI002DBEE1BF|nr:FAD-dependent monooxygenase [Actinophytocola sp.]HEU5472964.1 FAD-dependent monooxygenase [Actinophytocola sp.]